MPLAYERASREWNWVGVIMYWFWKRPDESERDQPSYYFRMVEPDFTTLPVFDAMREAIATELPMLYKGTHQADHRFISSNGVREIAEGAQFDTALRLSEVAFAATGTHVLIRWRGSESVRVYVDEGADTLTLRPDANGWTESLMHSSVIGETHSFNVEGDAPFLLDSVSVYDRSLTTLLPPIVAVGSTVLVWLVSLLTLLLRGRRV
jgi:hypothetical protein